MYALQLFINLMHPCWKKAYIYLKNYNIVKLQ